MQMALLIPVMHQIQLLLLVELVVLLEVLAVLQTTQSQRLIVKLFPIAGTLAQMTLRLIVSYVC